MNIWIMKLSGFWRIWQTEDNVFEHRKITIVVLKWFDNIIYICQVIGVLYLIVILIFMFFNSSSDKLIDIAMAFLLASTCVFMRYWYNSKAEVIRNVIFTQETEYAENRHEYQLVKSLSFYGCILFFYLPIVILFLLTVIQFYSDEYVQYLYDECNPVWHVDVTSCPFIFRLFAIDFALFLFLIVILGNANMMVVMPLLFVFTRRKFEITLKSAKYDTPEDLKKTRKQLSDIEKAVIQINDFGSLPLMFFIVMSTLVFCYSVLKIFNTDKWEMLPGINTNATVIVISLALAAAVLLIVTVLYCDRKADQHVRFVYQISAKRNPNDLEFAIQADMLAKHINCIKVLLGVWKFYKMNRPSLLNYLVSVLSYVILVIQMITAEMDFIFSMNE